MSERPQIVSSTDEHAADAPLGARFSSGQRRDAPALPSPHSSKFKLVTAILVGLAVSAVAVAITVLVTADRGASRAQWSSWSPLDTGPLATREIADHIAPLYRISPVDQLSVVTVVNLASSSSAAASSSSSSSGSSNGLQVAVRSDPTQSAVSVLNGNTVGYNLCGIGGPNCAIGVGTPSADRLLLLRREALELALYTFKYVGGTQNVVAILPPGHTTATSSLSAKPPTTNPPPATTKPLSVALLFIKDELAPFLSQPLAATLPEQYPPTIAQIRSAPEAGLVEQITARGLFSQKLVQAQDGSTLIVLDPMPPQ